MWKKIVVPCLDVIMIAFFLFSIRNMVSLYISRENGDQRLGRSGRSYGNQAKIMHLFVLKHVDWKKLIKRSKTDNKCLAETFNNMQMHYSTEVHSLNVYLPSQTANQMKGISQLTGCTREKKLSGEECP